MRPRSYVQLLRDRRPHHRAASAETLSLCCHQRAPDLGPDRLSRPFYDALRPLINKVLVLLF